MMTTALGWVSWLSLNQLSDRIAAIGKGIVTAENFSPPPSPARQARPENGLTETSVFTPPLSAADQPGAAWPESFQSEVRIIKKEVMKTWLLTASGLLLGIIATGFFLRRIRTGRTEAASEPPELFCLPNQPANPGQRGEGSLPRFHDPMTDHQLWESRQKLQLVLDNIPQYVFWKDRQSVYQGCNRNFALAAGVGEAENIVGKCDHELAWAGEEAEWYLRCDQEVMTNGIPLYHIAESQRKADGQKIWIDTNKIPLHDTTGKVVGILGTYEDITERKLAEENLTKALADAERAREKIDAILKSMTEGLLVVDLEGRIQLINRVAEKIAGIPPDSGLEQPLQTVIPEKGLLEQISRTIKGKRSVKPLEWQVRDSASDQDRTFVTLSSKVKNKNGEITGALTILRDVTREREIDRMKNEFIATAAHELRTPLTTIMGFSEILQKPEEFGIDGEEQKQEFISTIHESACRLNTIVSDLLDLSRVQSGRMITLHRVPCDITELLRGQVKKYRSEKGHHQYTCSIPDRVLPMLIDPAKLEQVVDNLMSNAVKFSAKGSTVQVIGEIIDDSFQVTVADQGIGMTPEQVERVFDKFFRADTSDTAPEGLGLGMAIVKNIIEAHDGRIWLESEAGIGTKVCFSLKISQAAPENGPDKNLPAEKTDLL
ncbi:MAG: PAS domain-containing protein [Desulfuromonadaceae bacterium]|nr:PAS domain-containing protein [Desulfuromonadaceae bacterium]